MQKRAGLLYLSLNNHRIFLILENEKWTVPTFSRKDTLFEDSRAVTDVFIEGKILPIELYTSKDKGFEFSTYICLVSEEFIPSDYTICWSKLDQLPKNIHTGLKNTLNSNIIKTKIETILELQDAIID
jgi:hypothetical protein